MAQNPGINLWVKNFYRERLSIAAKEKQIVIDVKRDRDDLAIPLTIEQRDKMSINELKIRDYKAANFERWLSDEADQIIELRNKTKIINR